MKTVSQIVGDLIIRKPFLAELLGDGLINLSSLARQLKQDVEQQYMDKVETGTIVMALKRYQNQTHLKSTIKLEKALAQIIDIIVRSKLVDYTFKNSDSLVEKHIKLLKKIANNNEVFYIFVQGVFETNLVVSESLKPEIDKLFINEKRTSFTDKLSSVTLKLPAENTEVTGFYYHILRKIAWEGINIVEVISTTNEFTIVVNDKDVDKAFSVLKSMS